MSRTWGNAIRQDEREAVAQILHSRSSVVEPAPGPARDRPAWGTDLRHVSKERIAAVVTDDAVGVEQAQPVLAMKKAQAPAAAEQLLGGKGWVPELMRGQPLHSTPVATVKESDE